MFEDQQGQHGQREVSKEEKEGDGTSEITGVRSSVAFEAMVRTSDLTRSHLL